MTIPLPPLPPTVDDEAGYRPGGRSVLEILAEEHRRISALCAELTEGRGAGRDERRRELVDLLTAAVSRHLSAEEQYLYPAARAALPDGDEVAQRETAADVAVRRALAELGGTEVTDPEWAARADAVAGLLHRHVERLTGRMFPELRAAAGTAELIRLGNRVEIAEEAAPTRPHPDAPVTPPWNRVVDPALGVVDKVRDAVTGRRTYPQDEG